ncbi:CoA protein activase [Candidatus Atribacteria bacterium MT.SAG.1]|nr:CoA protein activase [Candidatus Atribacteria bacterium MT.SAG.1]
MKVTMPNLGNLISIAGKSLLSNLGHEVILPPPNSKRTLDLGVRYAPEYCCLPLKIVLGNFIEALEKGADTIIMAGGWGPCRFGYYAEIQRMILKSLGYKFEMISLEIPRGNLIRVLNQFNRLRNKKSFSSSMRAFKLAWAKVIAIEELEKEALKARPRENIKGGVSKILKKGLSLIDNINSIEEIEKIKQEILINYNKIIEGNENKDLVKIKLVGELYVALEPFVNHNIEEKLGDLGVEVERGVSVQPWISSMLKFLKSSNEQEDIIEKAAKPYLSQSVGGEGQSTIGHIVLASEKGMDGAIQVIPFTCMPEIVAETISKKVSEDLNFPVLTLIYDEQTGEEGLITRIDAFVDLLKMKKNKRHLVKI